MAGEGPPSAVCVQVSENRLLPNNKGAHFLLTCCTWGLELTCRCSGGETGETCLGPEVVAKERVGCKCRLPSDTWSPVTSERPPGAWGGGRRMAVLLCQSVRSRDSDPNIASVSVRVPFPLVCCKVTLCPFTPSPAWRPPPALSCTPSALPTLFWVIPAECQCAVELPPFVERTLPPHFSPQAPFQDRTS